MRSEAYSGPERDPLGTRTSAFILHGRENSLQGMHGARSRWLHSLRGSLRLRPPSQGRGRGAATMGLAWKLGEITGPHLPPATRLFGPRNSARAQRRHVRSTLRNRAWNTRIPKVLGVILSRVSGSRGPSPALTFNPNRHFQLLMSILSHVHPLDCISSDASPKPLRLQASFKISDLMS